MNRLDKWYDKHPKTVLVIYISIMFLCLSAALLGEEGFLKTLNTVLFVGLAIIVTAQIIKLKQRK